MERFKKDVEEEKENGGFWSRKKSRKLTTILLQSVLYVRPQRNENTDSIIQLLYDIENITYREEKEND